MDTFLYAPRAADGAADQAGAGGRGAGGMSAAAGAGGGTMVYGCRAAGEAGAEALFMRIVDMASEAGDWLRTDQRCTMRSDCREALLTPECDRDTAQCVPCPMIVERTLYSSRLIGCIAERVALCCADPTAQPDCVFRGCVGGCGPQ
jgi:hypothetical protein